MGSALLPRRRTRSGDVRSSGMPAQLAVVVEAALLLLRLECATSVGCVYNTGLSCPSRLCRALHHSHTPLYLCVSLSLYRFPSIVAPSLPSLSQADLNGGRFCTSCGARAGSVSTARPMPSSVSMPPRLAGEREPGGRVAANDDDEEVELLLSDDEDYADV